MKKRTALRADTTLAPVGEVEREIYVQALPTCCLRSFKTAALANAGDRRRLTLECGCGRKWWITSSLDERVLERFVMHGGPRVRSGHGPSAA